MTLSATVVGALIREQIEMEQTEEPTLTSIPIPTLIPKEKKRELFEDINGIPFDIGSTYMSYKVHKIVRCKVLKFDKRNIYKNGEIYPVNEKGYLIKPTGVVSNMYWSSFENYYEFTLVTVTTKENKEANLFTYTAAEAKLRDKAGDKAARAFHEGVIKETIEHCRHKRNMSVIKDKSLINHLKESTFWNELSTYGYKAHRFDNITMASTIWRYKGEWIISSHSAYLKIMTGDR